MLNILKKWNEYKNRDFLKGFNEGYETGKQYAYKNINDFLNDLGDKEVIEVACIRQFLSLMI